MKPKIVDDFLTKDRVFTGELRNILQEFLKNDKGQTNTRKHSLKMVQIIRKGGREKFTKKGGGVMGVDLGSGGSCIFYDF